MVASSSSLREPELAAPVVTSPLLASLPWLMHGFSTRLGGVSSVYGREGDCNLGWTATDDAEHVAENRRRLAAEVSQDDATPFATLKQIHSATTVRVSACDAAPRATTEADGMMTAEPGVLLAVQTADCIPVLVADTRLRAVAGFHAGWRGTVAAIVEEGIARMHEEFGSEPEELVAAIGPGIGPCCYAVGNEVRQRFAERFPYADALFSLKDDGSLHLNLWEANRQQLLAAGLKAKAVWVAEECTSCRVDRYFSYRKENGFTGRMFSVIGIRD
ncbi:peptidoglycan editing factor PgeF [Silvibacterium sp.]|uniref:peptidoglycan editing factor PgeF n=1 Tax=Silvibacterium sp. TaxID=1964179 RepID=UPI0039E5EA58